MKRSTLVITLIAAILAIGGIAFLAHRTIQPLDKPQTTSVAPAPASKLAKQADSPSAQPTAAHSTGSADQKPAAPTLRVKALNIDTSKELAEACISFSVPLITDAKYQDYLTVQPDTKVAI